jgi:hypothetical protein
MKGVVPDLNISFNSLDSPFEDIEPPGQTAQKEKVELLEKPRRAVTLRAHLQELVVKSGFGQLGGGRVVQTRAYIAQLAQ